MDTTALWIISGTGSGAILATWLVSGVARAYRKTRRQRLVISVRLGTLGAFDMAEAYPSLAEKPEGLTREAITDEARLHLARLSRINPEYRKAHVEKIEVERPLFLGGSKTVFSQAFSEADWQLVRRDGLAADVLKDLEKTNRKDRA